MARGDIYYLQIQTDFFEREEIKVIESLPNGQAYINFYLKLLLRSANTMGELRFRDLIPYSPEMLASITNTQIDTVRVAVDTFLGLGLMQKWDDGTLFMHEVKNMIGKESQWAEIKRRQREKKKLDIVQQMSNGCPKLSENCPTEQEQEQEQEQKLSQNNARETKISFQKFRSQLAEAEFVFELSQTIAGYAPETKFRVKSTGYIHCLKSQKDVSAEDAKELWDFLYQRRSAVLVAIEKDVA